MYFLEEEVQIEKRRYSRISYREAVQYKVLGHTCECGGSLSYDVSETGLRLQLEYFVPINAQIVLNFLLKDINGSKVVTIHGRVAWVRQVRYSDRYQVGLEFSEPDLLIYKQIREALSCPST